MEEILKINTLINNYNSILEGKTITGDDSTIVVDGVSESDSSMKYIIGGALIAGLLILSSKKKNQKQTRDTSKGGENDNLL